MLIISVVLSASKSQSVWSSVSECHGVSIRGRHLDASVQGSSSKSYSRSQHFLMSASGGRSQRSASRRQCFGIGIPYQRDSVLLTLRVPAEVEDFFVCFRSQCFESRCQGVSVW